MTRQDSLAARSAPFLPTDAEIRHAFVAQAAPHRAYFLITYLTGLTMFWITYRCVAITAEAIFVLEASKPSGGAKPTSLIASMPRRTRLGPVSGRWAKVTLLGETYWVHRRFHADIAAADSEAGFD